MVKVYGPYINTRKNPWLAGTTVDGYRLLRGRWTPVHHANCQSAIHDLSTVHGSTPGRNDRAGTTLHGQTSGNRQDSYWWQLHCQLILWSPRSMAVSGRSRTSNTKLKIRYTLTTQPSGLILGPTPFPSITLLARPRLPGLTCYWGVHLGATPQTKLVEQQGSF
ncbi:hypothetical protein PtB15_13B362 [Puccinia triticina]|nr:hypothetical protein PtB15_13B362 [Puccinia triticina]